MYVGVHILHVLPLRIPRSATILQCMRNNSTTTVPLWWFHVYSTLQSNPLVSCSQIAFCFEFASMKRSWTVAAWLLYEYPLTIQGMQYHDSTVILWHDSTCLWQLHWCPSTLPPIPFDNSLDILWRVLGWAADYPCGESAHFIQWWLKIRSHTMCVCIECISKYYTVV